METIRSVVEDIQTVGGRRFALFIQTLIVLNLISFALETLPDLTNAQRSALGLFETVCIIVFTLEYLLRVVVTKRKAQFIFSFYGIIDLLAILPFYLSLGFDLRSIRVFRLLRLFRAFKLVRYNSAIRRFNIAFGLVKEELILFLTVAAMIMFLSASGIYFFEHEAQPDTFSSIFSSLWWAVATLTTVGYGDIYPVTAGGKTFTFLVLLVGLGVVAIPAGLVASALSKTREIESQADPS